MGSGPLTQRITRVWDVLRSASGSAHAAETQSHERHMALIGSRIAAWAHLGLCPLVVLGYMAIVHPAAIVPAAVLVAANTAALLALLWAMQKRPLRSAHFLPFFLHVGVMCNAQIVALMWIAHEGPHGFFFFAYVFILFGAATFTPAPLGWAAATASLAPLSYAAFLFATRGQLGTSGPDLLILTVLAVTATAANLGLSRRYRFQVEQRVAAEVASRRLAELDQAKSEFFAAVGHDLMNPLSAVYGPIKGALQDKSLKLPPFHARSLQLALRASTRLEAMISDLLELARIDAGVGTLRLARADVVELAREQLQAMETYARGVGQKLCLDAPDGEVVLTVDPGKLARVLMNLISNACKFAPRGTAIRVGVRATEGGVEIEVEDHGPGIPAEEQEKIFRRFERGRGSKGLRGSGIGLAVVREFVELHGGSVRLVSEPGKGATFVVSVPDNAGAEPAASLTPAA